MIIINYYEKSRRYHIRLKWLTLSDIGDYIISGEEIRVMSKTKNITAITLAKVLALVATDNSCDEILKLINKENDVRKKKNGGNLLATARICRGSSNDRNSSKEMWDMPSNRTGNEPQNISQQHM